MKKLITLVSPILVVLTIAHAQTIAAAKTLFMGAIQFPKSLVTLPDLRIYYGGNIIKYEKHTGNNSITFSFPDDKRKTEFCVIITETIKFAAIDNTIEYIKIPVGQPYKCYKLALTKTENSEPTKEQIKSKQDTSIYSWAVTPMTLKENKIPDDAIIACYTPHYVEKMEGGSSIELPKIIIKDNVIELAGSESNLIDSSIALLLSSLDTDAIHANITKEIKQDYQHKRVTIAT